MTVTRADVAKRAGTSPALVSYVLNGGPRSVAPATRERILAAIAELGYRPNTVARSLRMGSGHVLGLIVPDSANPYFAGLARAIEERAFQRGFPLLVGNAADEDQREVDYLHAFIDRRVDGLIVIPTRHSAALASAVAAASLPVVVLDRLLEDDDLLQVHSDDEGGARAAVEHLIEHGHRNIACLSGPDVSTSQGRVAGYRAALAAAGLADGHIVRAQFGGAAGYHALDDLLAGPQRPTAVFVTSDLQAIGLLRAAYDAGVRVPDDLAVASFDGIEYAAWTTPGLTTVVQPVAELADRAVELLLGPAGGGERESGGGVHSVPTTLRVRGSCGCQDEWRPPERAATVPE